MDRNTLYEEYVSTSGQANPLPSIETLPNRNQYKSLGSRTADDDGHDSHYSSPEIFNMNSRSSSQDGWNTVIHSQKRLKKLGSSVTKYEYTQMNTDD